MTSLDLHFSISPMGEFCFWLDSLLGAYTIFELDHLDFWTTHLLFFLLWFEGVAVCFSVIGLLGCFFFAMSYVLRLSFVSYRVVSSEFMAVRPEWTKIHGF